MFLGIKIDQKITLVCFPYDTVNLFFCYFVVKSYLNVNLILNRLTKIYYLRNKFEITY